MPVYLMSICTSRGPTSRRSMVIGWSGAVAETAAKAFTVGIRSSNILISGLRQSWEVGTFSEALAGLVGSGHAG